jgi:hypothetical protein
MSIDKRVPIGSGVPIEVQVRPSSSDSRSVLMTVAPWATATAATTMERFDLATA